MIKNKLKIFDEVSLKHEEERISKLAAIKLWDSGYIDKLKPGTFNSLKEIHKKLFEDIYEFAGKIRTQDLSKENFRFASSLYLNEAIKTVEKMPQKTIEEITNKYIEMNIVHPFREGNGRAGRIWLDLIFKKELNKVIDWKKINKKDYLNAMRRSPICNIELLNLFNNALIDYTQDREVFIKGLDISYEYEGFNKYKTNKLAIKKESYKNPERDVVEDYQNLNISNKKSNNKNIKK